MAFKYPDKPWVDGQTVRREMDDKTVLIGKYSTAKNLWAFSRAQAGGNSSGGLTTTADVFTLNERPAGITRSPFTGEHIITQQEANWFLQDQVEQILFVGDSPPPLVDGEQVFTFWFDSDTLELLLYYNEQWFPVSIPPAQIATLRQEIDALYEDTTANRLNIAITQQELDLKVLETKERIDEVEATANDAEATANAAKDAADAATNASANAALVNENNTFSSSKTNTFNGTVESNKVISVKSPSNNSQDPNFEILGTSRTGTTNSRVLYTFNSGTPTRLQARYRGPLVHDDELVNKAYVDNLISIANAPARYSWEVRTNYPGHFPMANKCNMDTNKLSTSEYIYLSFQGFGMDRPIQGVDANGVTVYHHSSGGTGHQAMVLSCWFKHTDGTWKWKGTAEVREVKFYDVYMRIQTKSGQRWANDEMTTGYTYHFTLSGLF